LILEHLFVEKEMERGIEGTEYCELCMSYGRRYLHRCSHIE
jgi:hypothetical protein